VTQVLSFLPTRIEELKTTRRKEKESMIDRPILDLESFVLLMFATMVGYLVTTLSYESGMSFSQALLTGGGSAGAALLWARTVIKPPKRG